MLALYDLPVAFWRTVLGEGLHFHMGHYPSTQSLEEGMRLAVSNLLQLLPNECKPQRILDVGCGWGGPAFQLASIYQDCEIVGLVYSQTQADYINLQATQHNTPVKAVCADAQNSDFESLGKFDLAVVCESLDHMSKRAEVLAKLRKTSRTLALTTHCRNSRAPRESLHNEYMDIPSVETKASLVDLLDEAGWNFLSLLDRTSLTFPVWKLWQENLVKLSSAYPKESKELSAALSGTEQLYRKGMLYSVQTVAQ